MELNHKILERRIGYEFRNPSLLLEALTHRSYASERGLKYDNQRFEFLGDAIVSLIVSERLFHSSRDMREGELTELRADAVNRDSLSARAAAIELGPHLRMGKGEDNPASRGRPSILCDAFEALIAAVYLDSGMESARELLDRLLPAESKVALVLDMNPKGALQDHAQKRGTTKPVYEVLETVGPDHKLTYMVRVVLHGVELGVGSGSNKKEAEKSAARDALIRISQVDAPAESAGELVVS